MGMSFSYGPPKDKKEMSALLGAAVDRGITFFDTAPIEGPGGTYNGNQTKRLTTFRQRTG